MGALAVECDLLNEKFQIRSIRLSRAKVSVRISGKIQESPEEF